MFQARVLDQFMGKWPMRKWEAEFFWGLTTERQIPKSVAAGKTKHQESFISLSPEVGYPLTLKCGLTVAHFRLGVGANYLESFGWKQPFLLLSSGALIQQGRNKHGEIEAHRFHKIDQMHSTGEKRKRSQPYSRNCILSLILARQPWPSGLRLGKFQPFS